MGMADNIIDLAEKRTSEKKTQEFGDLHGMLLKSDKGAVLGIMSNMILILGNDPTLAGLCGYDEFQCLHIIHHPAPSPLDGAPPQPGPYPRAWTDTDVSHVLSYIQRVWTPNAKKTDLDQAMAAVAVQRRFHPIRDWLNSLKWDGVPRLNQWLHKAFGAADTEYHSDVAACFLIAAVRRVKQPGIKFDHMPVLEGGQGIGKSTAIRELFGPQFFTDALPAALESRDAALGLQGAWCVEFAEIEQIIRTEVEVIKAFLSRSVDRFRAPYGRTFLTYPRQCVLIGTTNDTDYLRDATGNRRFWPVRCQFVEMDWLIENREQLWAEATIREASGEAHWIREVESLSQASEAQDERQQEDVWEDKILSFLSGRARVTTGEILTEALFIPVERQAKKEQMRVSSILKRMRWSRQREWVGDRQIRFWEKGGPNE